MTSIIKKTYFKFNYTKCLKLVEHLNQSRDDVTLPADLSLTKSQNVESTILVSVVDFLQLFDLNF